MRSVAVLSLAALAAAPAQASVLDIYGYNPRGTAMGNAQAAVADDYTATFYNPAGLTRRKKVAVGAGFMATFPDLYIDRDFQTEEQTEVQSELPPSFSGFNLGAVFPLGGLVGNRVALGIGLYLPTLNVLRGEGIDPQIPQYYRYQNLPDKLVALASVAVEPFDWISVGGGIQVLAAIDGEVALDIEIANRRVERQSLDIEIAPTTAPVLGLLVRPFDGLSVGASYRGELQLDYAIPVDIAIDDLIDLRLDIGGTALYVPDYWNFGVAYDWRGADLLASAEVTWARWSRAPDPSPTFTADIDGTLAAGLGLEDRLDVGNGRPVDLKFRDVPVYKIGVEQRPHPKVRLRAGYTYRPTPAPVPEDVFNYIDNDAHMLAGGVGFSFADPLEVHRSPVSLDIVYQVTVMEEERVAQRAADDRVGDYDAGGIIHGLQISFRHDL